jgi:hypothetical protein
MTMTLHLWPPGGTLGVGSAINHALMRCQSLFSAATSSYLVEGVVEGYNSLDISG